MANCRANLPRRENTILTTLCETHLYSQEYHHKQGAAPPKGEMKRNTMARVQDIIIYRHLNCPTRRNKQTKKHTPEKQKQKQRKKRRKGQQQKSLFFSSFFVFFMFFLNFFGGFQTDSTVHHPLARTPKTIPVKKGKFSQTRNKKKGNGVDKSSTISKTQKGNKTVERKD